MQKERIIETVEGIQGEFDVAMYDQMQRHLRNKGYMETDDIIKSGITSGSVLEVGPGPGYLGLEWLSKTKGTDLTCLEISQEMIKMARKNVLEYGLQDRAGYTQGNALAMPFDDNTFDGAFSNGSLHEWEDPAAVLGEMHRVVKPGGRIFVSDLRRDMSRIIFFFMKLSVKPKSIKPGFISSLNAAYTKEELEKTARRAPFSSFQVKTSPFGLSLIAVK